MKIDKRKIPPKEWTWNNAEDSCEGVHTREQKLVWFTVNHSTMNDSKSVSQSYEDFVRDGPPFDDVPFDVMIELYEKILFAVDSII